MKTGAIISGIGHLCLILWLLFGGMLFPPDKSAPLQVADVSLITDAQLNALTAQASAPPGKPQTAIQAPKPKVEPNAPAKTPTPEPRPKEITHPKAEPQPKADTAPKPPAKIVPPKTVVAAAPPPPPVPSPQSAPNLTPPPPPKSEPRVAPTPAPPPPPDVKTADQLQPEVTANPTAPPSDHTKPKEAAAPKAAAVQIVPKSIKSDTTAPSPDLAPSKSIRPLSRPPEPPPQTAATTPEPKAPQPNPPAPNPAAPKPAAPAASVPETATNAAVAAALAGLNAAGGTGNAADAGTQPATRSTLGTGLTQAEKDGLRLAVQRCWIVDVGSKAANVTVTVGTALNQDGTVVPGSVKLISSSGGDSAAVQAAFDAARRAILRCGADGFKLPPQKYDQWREIEMVFNPDGMRLR